MEGGIFVNHDLIKVSDFAYQTRRKLGNGKSSFIKVEGTGNEGYGDVMTEYTSYSVLKPYLNMPRTKVINTSDSNRILVLEKVQGVSLDKFVGISLSDTLVVLQYMFNDIMKMWELTKLPMDENRLERNIRLSTIDTLNAVKNRLESYGLINHQIIINGKCYPPLSESIGMCLRSLFTLSDKLMVISHGDEHFENIFKLDDELSRKYMIIDPRIAGYYSPAHTINTLITYPELFLYKYNTEAKFKAGKIVINYRLSDDFAEMSFQLKKQFKFFIHLMDILNGQQTLLRYYMFGNFLRTLIGRVNSKKIHITEKSKFAHLAIAHSVLYEFEDYLNY